VAVKANNVADYFFVTNDQDYWDLSEFPNIAPPWPNIWIEYNLPKYINSREFGYRQNPESGQASRIGTLLLYKGIKEFKITMETRKLYVRSLIMINYIKELESKGVYFNQLSEIDRGRVMHYVEDIYKKAINDPTINHLIEEKYHGELKALIAKKVKWIFIARHFIEPPNGPVLEIPSNIQGFVNESGQFEGIGSDQGGGILIVPEKYIEPEKRKIWANPQLLFVPFMTLSFCHCKNVTIEQHQLTKGKNSSKKEKNSKASYKYYTLIIDHIKETIKKEGSVEQTGLKKALHICRGHFATYTAEAPLFGRLMGTFWKPMHVRGRAEHGIVSKDYMVKV
jgi:hypothetical protein